MLTVFRPSSEVVREGRILKGNQPFIRPIVGVFMVDDSWAHTQAAIRLPFFIIGWYRSPRDSLVAGFY
jgi:hypothetical protein